MDWVQIKNFRCFEARYSKKIVVFLSVNLDDDLNSDIKDQRIEDITKQLLNSTSLFGCVNPGNKEINETLIELFNEIVFNK